MSDFKADCDCPECGKPAKMSADGKTVRFLHESGSFVCATEPVEEDAVEELVTALTCDMQLFAPDTQHRVHLELARIYLRSLLAALDALRGENERLRAQVRVAREYAEERHDVLDGSDGQPKPNEWMHLTNEMKLIAGDWP